MWRNATKKGKSNLKKKSMYRMVFDTEFNLAFHMPKKMPANTVSGINN